MIQRVKLVLFPKNYWADTFLRVKSIIENIILAVCAGRFMLWYYLENYLGYMQGRSQDCILGGHTSYLKIIIGGSDFTSPPPKTFSSDFGHFIFGFWKKCYLKNKLHFLKLFWRLYQGGGSGTCREAICGRTDILQGYCWRMRHCERGI